MAVNAAVTGGDWAPFVARFAEHGALQFTGRYVASFQGRAAIAEAYRADPPDDTVAVLDERSTPTADTLRFQWSRGGTGTLWLAWTGRGEIARMVVDLD